jgi:hypothetical protein
MFAHVFTDASEATHVSGHGQCGVFATLGSGYIGCRSSKITMVTLSSKEAEQFAAGEGGTWAVFLQAIVPRLGHELSGPVKFWQDNNGSIADSIKEGSFSRNKHIFVRKGFIRELVQLLVIVVNYLATQFMPADMLTKPVGIMLNDRHMKKVGLVRMKP